MRHQFLAPAVRARWAAAFPDLELLEALPSVADVDSASLYWLDLSALPGDARGEIERAVAPLSTAGIRFVVLSTAPSEAEAFTWLSLGARGYCHAEAVPEQLQEVASVVAEGGLWMPPALVQRVMSVAARLGANATPRTHPALDQLTHREEQVAVLVGRGFNNREIAESLGVSERTVKANLTSIFDKLDLRDRVQLALHVNRLPIH